MNGDAIGAGVSGIREGDEFVVLPGASCGACEACQSGVDPLCRDYDFLGESCDGTSAEYVCLPVANVAPKPASLSFEQAVSVCLVFQTAWNTQGIRCQAQKQPIREGITTRQSPRAKSKGIVETLPRTAR